MQLTKLSHKLFLAILGLSLVILVSMVFLSKWALETGFLNYLNETENSVLARLKPDLEALYEIDQTWDLIVNDQKMWRALLRKHLHLENTPQLETDTDSNSKKSTAPAHHGNLWRGIRLLDADRKVLIGRELAKPNAKELELQNAGISVGYLSLNPTTEIRDELALNFTKQLVRTIQYSALGVLVICALLALWLAKGFVDPIKALVSGTRALTGGEFSKRLVVDSKDELGQLAKDFNNLAATLESNEHSRKQWIADISHELRTPLTVLRGEVEAMKDGVHEISPKLLDSLHTEILQLQTIIGDLYELSLSDVGALSYKKVRTDIFEVITEVIGIFEEEFESSKLKLNINKNTNEALMAVADPRRLHQLFSNVISNSLRYTDAGGQLNINVDTQGEHIHIDFEDSAPGVAESDLPKLFERLYRVENSRSRKLGGTGLGLSICKNIVDAHQGQIEATQSKYGGLHIHITLPKLQN